MFTKLTLAAAAAVAIAAPAGAATQLEKTLGVEAGVYSTAELLSLQTAIADHDQQRIEYILEQQGGSDAVATRDALNPTAAERAAIRSALEANEFNRAQFVAENGLDSETDASSAGKAQLAAALRVDPADHSLAELVALRSAIEEDNDD